MGSEGGASEHLEERTAALRGLCLLTFNALGALVGQPSLLTLSAAIHEGSLLHKQQSVHPS